MFEVRFKNGTVCQAMRVVAVMSPHDDAGDKTYYIAQIATAKRRIDPRDVASVVFVE